MQMCHHKTADAWVSDGTKKYLACLFVIMKNLLHKIYFSAMW